MGMKAYSGHFPNLGLTGGLSSNRRLQFSLDIQFFGSNYVDPKISAKGKAYLEMATNQSLRNTIAELYRPGAVIGDGGTADALRQELRFGININGKNHLIKAKERIVSLTRLIDNGRLSRSDEIIARSLRNDLLNAMKGK